MDVPLAPHSLFYVSISPEGDFRFEVGTRSDPQRCHSTKSSSKVNLNVWTHLAFSQQVDRSGSVGRRVLYLDGEEVASKQAPGSIYNPAPSMTRMAILRGVWGYKRNAPFVGQVENIGVYQRTMSKGEVVTRASRVNAPADHGWQTNDEVADVY
ncbi:hypothetical protein FRC10_009151 [Ceratobasidium sp. 414]|nr:hypothetical protein FRC10_009151 [Ceratobasidium sp. 414]